jgi:hypothetical protein
MSASSLGMKTWTVHKSFDYVASNRVDTTLVFIKTAEQYRGLSCSGLR